MFVNYNKLHKIVESSKLSVGQLCKKLDISRSTFYNNIQDGTMRIDTLEGICNILNVPIWEFFYETKPFEEQENTANLELLKAYKRITELQDELSECKAQHSIAAEAKENYTKKKKK